MYLVGSFPVSCDRLADEISDQDVPISTRNYHADGTKADSDFHDEGACCLNLLPKAHWHDLKCLLAFRCRMWWLEAVVWFLSTVDNTVLQQTETNCQHLLDNTHTTFTHTHTVTKTKTTTRCNTCGANEIQRHTN